MEKKYLRLKPKIKMLTFQLNFESEVYLMDLATESREESLNRNVYNFSVDYSFIDKTDMLNIHKYLMTKNNIK